MVTTVWRLKLDFLKRFIYQSTMELVDIDIDYYSSLLEKFLYMRV